MNKKRLLIVITTAMLAVLIPAGIWAASNWHCCVNPSCDDCSDELLGCNCELKEKLGMEVCSDCAAAGCGQHEETGAMHSGVVQCH